jgi:hypothetical protein
MEICQALENLKISDDEIDHSLYFKTKTPTPIPEKNFNSQS